MTWAKWIAYMFDCAHGHTTWPQRSRTGLDYVCCLECGKEFPYSTRLMCIVSKEEQLKESKSVKLGRPRESQIRTHCTV
jgi:hypothetical protein